MALELTQQPINPIVNETKFVLDKNGKVVMRVAAEQTLVPNSLMGNRLQYTSLIYRDLIEQCDINRLEGNIFRIPDEVQGSRPVLITPSSANSINMHVRYFTPRTSYNVMIIDAPWRQPMKPTRGLSVTYPIMNSSQLTKIQLQKFQNEGFVLWWVTDATYTESLEYLERQGYTVLDELIWIKVISPRKIRN